MQADLYNGCKMVVGWLVVNFAVAKTKCHSNDYNQTILDCPLAVSTR